MIANPDANVKMNAGVNVNVNVNKRGFAVVVVIFFGFIVGILLYALVSSSSNIAMQNKQTLRQLQAYYLAQSGVQHVMLKLRLLPREIFENFSSGYGKPCKDVSSEDHPDLMVCPNGKFDLFSQNPPADSEPYRGSYHCVSFELESTHKRMKLVQDGYQLHIRAEVFPKFPASLKKGVADEIKEEIIVSRFTGGIGGP